MHAYLLKKNKNSVVTLIGHAKFVMSTAHIFLCDMKCDLLCDVEKQPCVCGLP